VAAPPQGARLNWTFDPERPRLSTLATFVGLSLLLHALLLAWLRGAHFSVAPPPDRPIVVQLAPAQPPASVPAKPAPAAPPAARPPEPQAPTAQAPQKMQPPAAPLRNQVVAPSDEENGQAPDKTALLSDRDNRVEKETVKRGNPEAGEKPPPPKAAEARPAPKPAPAAPKTGAPKPPPGQLAKAEAPKPVAPRAAPAPKPAPPRPAAQARPRPQPAPPPAEREDASPPEPVQRADARPMLEPPADRLDAPPRVEPRSRRAPPAPRPRPEPDAFAEPQPPSAPSRADARTRPAARGGKRALPGLDALLPPAAEVLADAGPAAGAGARRDAGGRTEGRDDPRRDLVSAPPPKPGFFGGPRGTFDSLPGVAQGSLTMLNTKADRFAPFVRRVGTRVFQNLLIFQRQNLGINDILAAHEPVTVRCLLDPEGHLKDITVEDRSGSLAVDQTLLDALRQAAFDSNPPRSAANANGDYEFVFVSQIAAQVGDGPGGPQVRMIESRLRVGLL